MFLDTEKAQVVEIINSCKARICLSCLVNAMFADVLATEEARASAAMALTLFSRNQHNNGNLIAGRNMCNEFSDG